MTKLKDFMVILIYIGLIVIDIFSLLVFELGFEKTSLKFIELVVILIFLLFWIKSIRCNGILSLYSLFFDI